MVGIVGISVVVVAMAVVLLDDYVDYNQLCGLREARLRTGFQYEKLLDRELHEV